MNKKIADGTDIELLDLLQRESFEYFLHEADDTTGLVADRTQPGSVASIAATGMALSCYVVGVERGYMLREEAVRITLKLFDFLYSSSQGTEPGATGYKGFYYHFLDMKTGRRARQCELSTMDTAILLAGVLTAQQYFSGESKEETRIRGLAAALYARVDWHWALNARESLSHGWTPEKGFIRHRWNRHYSEALLLYVLALGSPTFPIPVKGYEKWTSTFEWRNIYGLDYFYAGPLFIHQMSHVWIDFKGITDDMNKKYGIDYFENSRRATMVHQRYAIDNPLGFEGYGEHCWGITACDGPGPSWELVSGSRRYYYDYKARGAPYGPDDGTVAPWAVVASLPFAPEIVLATTREEMKNGSTNKIYHHGFYASFNPTFRGKGNNPAKAWISEWQYGINQGPIILMIENYRSGLVWDLIKNSPCMVAGLRVAGFTGGWLEK